MSNESADNYAVFAQLSEGLHRAAAGWHAVYDAMPPEKVPVALCIETMQRCAWEAYDGVTQASTARGTVSNAGHAAWCYVCAKRHLSELLGRPADDPHVVETFGKTLEWMASKGWRSLPAPTDADGNTHRKTAAGVDADMERYCALYLQFLKACAEPDGRSSEDDKARGAAKGLTL